jgi:hypothetical protein
VEVSLTRSGFAGYLAHRDRRWRDDEPTDRQLAYLRRFDRDQAALAEAEGWSKGDVSTAIDGHQVLGLLRKEHVV